MEGWQNMVIAGFFVPFGAGGWVAYQLERRRARHPYAAGLVVAIVLMTAYLVFYRWLDQNDPDRLLFPGE